MATSAGTRLILLDANFLITLAQTSTDDVWLQSFLGSLGRRHTIGIPAPSWAEFLSGSGNAASAFSKVVRSKSGIQVIPFDEMSAIECGFIDQKIRAKTGNKKGASTAAWQKIKIDRQILAIAAARKVTAVYTDDDGLIADAEIIGITTIKMCDIPRVPQQLPLLKTTNEE